MSRRKERSASMVGVSVSANSKNSARQHLLEHMKLGPWEWLSATDIDGTPIVFTKDEREGRFRPYPAEKLYLKELVDAFRSDRKLVIVEKSRQMVLTTTILLVSLWEVMTLEAQRILLSKITEDESKELLKDKVRGPWGKMPEWLKSEWPITPSPAGVVTGKNTGSVILALAENSADREVRGGGASRVIIDEAAFQEKTPDIVSAALPMAKQIDLITTPMSGVIGGDYIQTLIKGEAWKGV